MHTTDNARREVWGDVLKGALILAVVFWHVVMKSYLQVDWQLGIPVPGAWGLVADGVWPFMMPLFLLVSGYFAANALGRPWAAVWKPRVLRFFYLYLLWSLIHMVTMWAFPDFPTLVPRSVAEFVEFVTISPTNTWYMYALALYFLVAKALARVSPWVVIGAAGVLSVVVATGQINVDSNRGSLLYNLVFFLVGIHLAPQIRLFVGRATLPVLAAAVAVYGAAFAAMRMTGAQEIPGVWPLVSVLGIVMGLAAAPALSRVPKVGAGLAWLGRRSLPIYLIHMPLLALADSLIVGALNDARMAIQLAVAVTMPVLLTALLVWLSLVLDRLADRDGLAWLWDLPRRRTRAKHAPRSTGRRLVPWRTATAVVLLVAGGLVAAKATAIAGCTPDGPGMDASPSRPAEHPGSVTIGATGDLLIHNIGTAVPADGGEGYFDAVRPWFAQDIVTGNLEQVISDDTGHDKCGTLADCLQFRSAPQTAGYFDGFDLLNLANNHSGDFGPAGYADTQQNLAENDIRTTGGRDQISCTTIGDTTVAVVGFAPYGDTNRVTDLRHARKLVAAAAETADIVVVHSHMGAEGETANRVTGDTEYMFGENRGNPEDFSHAVVDAGADLVIGHGPHSLRGMEFYKDRLIAYSLGNFGGGGVFGPDPYTRYGVYLEAKLDAEGRYEGGSVRSVRFEFEGGIPLPDPDERAARLVDEFGSRDFPDTAATVTPTGEVIPRR